LLPTTGVALPFISYGGTALLFNSLGVGILISIARYRNPEAEKGLPSEVAEVAEVAEGRRA
jgi:cell division protein FtsW